MEPLCLNIFNPPYQIFNKRAKNDMATGQPIIPRFVVSLTIHQKICTYIFNPNSFSTAQCVFISRLGKTVMADKPFIALKFVQYYKYLCTGDPYYVLYTALLIS